MTQHYVPPQEVAGKVPGTAPPPAQTQGGQYGGTTGIKPYNQGTSVVPQTTVSTATAQSDAPQGNYGGTTGYVPPGANPVGGAAPAPLPTAPTDPVASPGMGNQPQNVYGENAPPAPVTPGTGVGSNVRGNIEQYASSTPPPDMQGAPSVASTYIGPGGGGLGPGYSGRPTDTPAGLATNPSPTDIRSGGPDFGGDMRRFGDAAFSESMRTLQPELDAGKTQFDQSMAGRGITEGSRAYNRARTEFDQSQSDRLNQARFGAMQFGQAAQQQAFGQGQAESELANAIRRAEISGNAQVAGARAGAGASRYAARVGAQSANYRAGLEQQGANYRADQTTAYDYANLAQGGDEFTRTAGQQDFRDQTAADVNYQQAATTQQLADEVAAENQRNSIRWGADQGAATAQNPGEFNPEGFNSSGAMTNYAVTTPAPPP